jgi:hypothetical protein
MRGGGYIRPWYIRPYKGLLKALRRRLAKEKGRVLFPSDPALLEEVDGREYRRWTAKACYGRANLRLRFL